MIKKSELIMAQQFQRQVTGCSCQSKYPDTLAQAIAFWSPTPASKALRLFYTGPEAGTLMRERLRLPEYPDTLDRIPTRLSPPSGSADLRLHYNPPGPSICPLDLSY